MDYSTFDNHTDPSDDNYFAFVRWLSELTASELRVAKGDPEQQKQALCRYYRRGDKANLTPSELIDFPGVSYPSILDMASYSDSLTIDEIDHAQLPE